MKNQEVTIPQPLVRANQFTIVIFILLTWVVGSPYFLLVPLLAGLLGLIFNFNPVMVLRRQFLTKEPIEYPQEDRQDQKFNQMIATTFLTLFLITFLAGHLFLGFLFSIIVFLAAGIALLGFCVGCFIRFQYVQYRNRRRKNR
jgi:hypothetical protein